MRARRNLDDRFLSLMKGKDRFIYDMNSITYGTDETEGIYEILTLISFCA